MVFQRTDETEIEFQDAGGKVAFGALLVGAKFFRSVVHGYLLLIASAVSLTFFTGLFQVILFPALAWGLA